MFIRKELLGRALVFLIVASVSCANAKLTIDISEPQVDVTDAGAGVDMLPSHHLKKISIFISVHNHDVIASENHDWENALRNVFEKAYKKCFSNEVGQLDFIQCQLLSHGHLLAKGVMLPKEKSGLLGLSFTNNLIQDYQFSDFNLEGGKVVFDCYSGWPKVGHPNEIEAPENLDRHFAYRLSIDKSDFQPVDDNEFIDRGLEFFKKMIGFSDSSWKLNLPLCSLDKSSPLFCIFVPGQGSRNWHVVLPKKDFMSQGGPFSYIGDGDRYLRIGENLFVDLAFWLPGELKNVEKVSVGHITVGSHYRYNRNIPCFGSEETSLAASHQLKDHDTAFDILLMGEIRHLRFNEKKGNDNKYDLTVSNIEIQPNMPKLYSIYSVSFCDPDLDGFNETRTFGFRREKVPTDDEKVVDLFDSEALTLTASQQATQHGKKKFTFVGVVDVLFDGKQLRVKAAGCLKKPHSLEVEGIGKVTVTCRSNKLLVEVTSRHNVRLDDVIPQGDPAEEIFGAEYKKEPSTRQFSRSQKDVDEKLLGDFKTSSRQFSKRNNPMSRLVLTIPVDRES